MVSFQCAALGRFMRMAGLEVFAKWFPLDEMESHCLGLRIPLSNSLAVEFLAK